MDSASLRSQYDVVIIGSGHNGLVAAGYLAKAGLSVLVLEANESIGGATASQKVFPDYDAWLSRYAYLISLLPNQILRELDVPFQTKVRRTASFTPYVREDRHGGLVLSNISPERSMHSIRELTGADSSWERYQAFLHLQSCLAQTVWPSLLEPLRSREDFRKSLANQEQRDAWKAFVERPLGESIEEFIDDDVLRGVVMTDGKIGVLTHPHDTSLLQNRCFLYHIIGQGTGQWTVPVGGMKSLVDGLVSVGRKHDVTFSTRSRATRVSLGSNQHTIHFESGETTFCVDANHVLVNATPRVMRQLLGETWSPSDADEGSVMKVNMLLRRLPKVKAAGVTAEEAFSGSLHIDEGYEQMNRSYAQALTGSLPDSPPCEIYCHTLTDNTILSAELRSQGFHTLTLFGLDVPYRVFREDHDAKRERVVELYLNAIDRFCDEPFRDCLARDGDGRYCIDVNTPQDLESKVGLDLGNIFHNELSWFFADDASEVGTWGVRTSHQRVYRAGSSATRGGAVSGIPGRNAAMQVLEDLGRVSSSVNKSR